jgi:outer membrane immunogenic protein
MSLRPACRLLLFLCVCPIFMLAQEPRSDVSIGGQAVWPFNSTSDTVSVESSISGGGLASFRYHLRGHSSVEASYAYSRSTFYYTVNEQDVGGGSIFLSQQGSMHQFTGDYVYNFGSWKKIQPFVLGGGGLVLFRPVSNSTNTLIAATNQGKGAVLYGAGFDYPLAHAFSVRIQYRGLFLKAPDFYGAAVNASSWMIVAAPAAQLVYHF